MTAGLYPTKPPPGTPATQVKTGLWRCGFCAGNNHASCPAMVRNGYAIERDDEGFEICRTARLVLCYCCGTGTDPRCLDCGCTDLDQVNAEIWTCVDLGVCRDRIRLRQENDRLYQMLQACKSAAYVQRRSIRLVRDQISADVPDDEDLTLDNLQASLRRRSARLGQQEATGSCLCCGEPTRGGLFRPGHDAKYKSTLRRSAASGDAGARTELEQRGWV